MVRESATCSGGRVQQRRLLLGIHLFQCPDTVGIVAKLSECIASHGGNIHSVDFFVPDDRPVVYARRIRRHHE